MFDSQQQVALVQLFFLQSLLNEQKQERAMNEKKNKASESTPAARFAPASPSASANEARKRESSPWPEHRRFWHRRTWRKSEHRPVSQA